LVASQNLPVRDGTNPAQLTHEYGISAAELEQIAQRLTDGGVVVRSTGGTLIASAQGQELFDTLARARESRLSTILAKWTHEQQPEIMALLDHLSRTLMAELPVERRAFARQ